MNRRILSFIIVSMMIVMAFMPMALAEGEKVEIALSSKENVKKGDEITLELTISDNSQISTGIIDIYYDKTFLEYTSLKADSVILQTMHVENPYNPGRMRLVFAATDNIAEGGILYTINFKVLDTASGSTELKVYADGFKHLLTADELAQQGDNANKFSEYSAIITNGTVTLESEKPIEVKPVEVKPGEAPAFPENDPDVSIPPTEVSTPAPVAPTTDEPVVTATEVPSQPTVQPSETEQKEESTATGSNNTALYIIIGCVVVIAASVTVIIVNKKKNK